MSQRRICIHGHFYQPPREDPRNGEVPRQPSAAPFRDWNRRITAESYAPNAAARVLGDHGEQLREVDNYAHMSFDFGPTLLAWLAVEAPEVHAAVVAADAASRERFGGQGSAMAQSYHHTILPLSHPRDRRTEVLWGVADFRHRFGREPQGMWLPETAVDLASLEELAAAGIKFTILEPHQAGRWRPGADEGWREPGSISSNPGAGGPGSGLGEPYLCRLPSGSEIALFFYDGEASRDVAFNGLLHDGDVLARRLVERYDERFRFSREAAELAAAGGVPSGRGDLDACLLSIATDGETYGHHHRHGEMALAWALGVLEEADGVRLTNYAEHLAAFPPRREVEVVENTSWSCPHGLGRWSQDCGCAGGEGQHGRWREPLRQAMDWLRQKIEGPWEQAAAELFRDPWAARDDSVRLLLDGSAEEQAAFFADHAVHPLDEAQTACARALLELQRNLLRCFTSCAWFFEDVARIEVVQILRYASRALDLSRALLGLDLESAFLDRLAAAPSSDPAYGDARQVYLRNVGPGGKG